MSKQTVTLKIDASKANGQETAEIAVNWRGRYLAVHRALSNTLPISVDKRAGYVITHIPTGLTVHEFHHFNARLAPVRAIAERLDTEAWNFTSASDADLRALANLVSAAVNG